jgi:hypothetical protein
LSRGSSPCGCPHEPLVSYRINRQLSVWNLPPLVIRALGAHCQKQTHALQQTACVLQVQVTKMAAQSSGNAFTGAVDDAISEGFSEGRGHKFES